MSGLSGNDTTIKKDQIFIARATYKTKKCALQELRPELQSLLTTKPHINILKEMKEVYKLDLVK